MNELDLLTQFHADVEQPSPEAWQRARAAIAGARADTAVRWPALPLRAATRRSPQRSVTALAATAGAAAAAAVGVLALTAGSTPAAARAFPILLTHASDLRDAGGASTFGSLRAWLPAAVAQTAAQDAHAAFSLPDAAGYVLESPDAGTLCIVAVPGPEADPRGVTSAGNCSPTADAEKSGLVMSFGFAPGEQDYAALVPTGGSATLSENGTTATLPLVDGIASGGVQQAATLTIQVGNSIRTYPLEGAAPAPSAPPGPGA